MILLLNFKNFFWKYLLGVLWFCTVFKSLQKIKELQNLCVMWSFLGRRGRRLWTIFCLVTLHLPWPQLQFPKTLPQQQTQHTRAQHSTSHDPNNRPKILLWICLCGIIFNAIQKIKIYLFICGTSNNIIASLKNFMWHKQQSLKTNINFKKDEKCINLLIKSNIKLV